MTDIPGLKAMHAVITPNCRVVQGGEDEAFTVATERLREALDTALKQWKMYAGDSRHHDDDQIESADDTEAGLFQAARQALTGEKKDD